MDTKTQRVLFNIVFIAVVASLVEIPCVFAQGETSAWDIVIPRVTFTNTPVPIILRYVEDMSAKSTDSGRGVRFLGTDGMMDYRVTVDWTNVTPNWIWRKWLIPGDTLIVEDVAISSSFGNRSVARCVPLFGSCHDADTKKPIKDFTILVREAGEPSDIVVRENGRFIGYATINVRRLFIPKTGGYVAYMPGWEGRDHATVIASAQGYTSQTQTVFVGDWTAPTRPQKAIDFMLNKKSKN
jgi:hypothetical protein